MKKIITFEVPVCGNTEVGGVVSKIRIPCIPKSALHLSQPTDRYETEQAEATDHLPRNRKGRPLHRKGTQIPEGNPEPAVWQCAPKAAFTLAYKTLRISVKR